MNDALIRKATALLDLLPDTLSLKLKLTANVLLHDWRMLPPVMFRLRDTMTLEQALACYEDGDEETRDWIRYYDTAGHGFAPLEDRSLFFYNCARATSRAPRKETPADRRRRQRDERAFARRTGLPRAKVSPEVAHFRHGLPLLPEAVRTACRGTDFIDAGAYVGDSAAALAEFNPRRIVSFEPDSAHETVFRRVMERAVGPGWREQISLIHAGLGAGETVQSFESFRGDHRPNQTIDCPVTTLDRVAQERNLTVGFLKADVEGMALALCRGGIRTILHDRPVLSLAVYHTAEEMFGIRPFLEEAGLTGYVWMLRSLNPDVPQKEITLLAYPKEKAE